MASAVGIRTLFLHSTPPTPSPKPLCSSASTGARCGVDGVAGVGRHRYRTGGWCCSGELVSFGMDFWSPETVEEALGAELAEAISGIVAADGPGSAHSAEVVALERERRAVNRLLGRECATSCPRAPRAVGEVPGFATGSRRRWLGQRSRRLSGARAVARALFLFGSRAAADARRP
jgi:hypothetical protein